MREYHPTVLTTVEDDGAQRRAALDVVTAAFIEAIEDGIDPEMVARAAIDCALRELIALQGEPETLRLLERLTTRVDNGEYSVHVLRN